jgi:hypothetical protein
VIRKKLLFFYEEKQQEFRKAGIDIYLVVVAAIPAFLNSLQLFLIKKSPPALI